ncbi:hypothetical protein CYMTET_34295 [Cymbomonas tetramitiformis]|uniref:Uncharacterized protein n=1 Tax=Cymbomonas tetramitiformis TaxID=36881 RepID=A0AAE0KQ40_9CHLO|nr:hypothetical protein CYMTET_34295 [Cymbomonas tetramitiformis]
MGHGTVPPEHGQDKSKAPSWLTHGWSLVAMAHRQAPRKAISTYEAIMRLPPSCQRARVDGDSNPETWRKSPFVQVRPTSQSAEQEAEAPAAGEKCVFTCAACHSGVAVNPDFNYRPVGGNRHTAHQWCERVEMPHHREGAPQGFSSTVSNTVGKEGLPEEPIWKDGVLKLVEEFVQPEGIQTCRHGFSEPALHVSFCRGVSVELKRTGIQKIHKKSMVQLQKVLFHRIGEKHQALHEPQAGISASEHHVALARETEDKGSQVHAYGNLWKSHLSRASKSATFSWQEKRDEEWARRYHAKYKTTASLEMVAERMRERAQQQAVATMVHESYEDPEAPEENSEGDVQFELVTNEKPSESIADPEPTKQSVTGGEPSDIPQKENVKQVTDSSESGSGSKVAGPADLEETNASISDEIEEA